MDVKPKSDDPPSTLPAPIGRSAIMKTMGQAVKGDAQATASIWKLIREGGEARSLLVDTYGNPFVYARTGLVKYAAGDDALLQDLLTRRIDQLSDEIAGPNATALEHILAERIALCWFEANELDRRFIDSSGKTYKDIAHQQDRRDRAHRRLLTACKALATIRKLALPAVQVNVARQQVNVAGSG